jgi:hypothetical protein
MSYRDSNAFIGLAPDFAFTNSGTVYQRVFFDYVEDEWHESAGTHLCAHTRETFPFDTYDVECPDAGDLTHDWSLGITDVPGPPIGSSFGGITTLWPTLADYIADRAPDYIQIVVRDLSSTPLSTAGGNPGCPTLTAPFPCLDPLDGTVTYDIATSLGDTYPYGVTEPAEVGASSGHTYHDQVVFCPGGVVDPFDPATGGTTTYLRRDPSSATYTGDPDNLATDTLIPVSEITGETFHWNMTGSPLNALAESAAEVVIYPWHIITPRTGGLMCVL